MNTDKGTSQFASRSKSDTAYLQKSGLYSAVARHAPGIEGIVVDYGCGLKPYKALFVNCSHYLGADLATNSLADIVYEIGSPLPLKDTSVDAIVSTQVLQAVRDPEQYLGECKRVLRSGGTLLLSTHGFWCYMGSLWKNDGAPRAHHDWRRWTHEGLIYEVEKAGFKVLDLDAICIRRAFLCQFVNLMLVSRLLDRPATRPLGRLSTRIVNQIGNRHPNEILSCSASSEANVAISYLVIAVSGDS